MTRQISRAESWERAYEAFQDINFNAFDYHSIKSGMIDYLKLHYPENFNDYIESSELIAIIELFAYAAELLAYRFDMNAHENFISTAARKQSVLRLAKLVSYNASRNIPIRGLVKLTSVSTTESTFDSRGVDISGDRVIWNDSNNPDWKEQFLLIINRILTQSFGSVLPSDRKQVDNVLFELYTLKNESRSNGILSYSVSAAGRSLDMELVPAALDQYGPYEKRPERINPFSIVYASDGVGDSSDFTGFFAFTKQGKLQRTTRIFDGITPNQSITLDAQNINDIDVWVNQVDPDTGELLRENSIDDIGGTQGYRGEWESVDTSNSRNILFNTNPKRNKYEIETLENDQVRIIFGDGEFADIPNGTFDIWYRTSTTDTVVIPKSEVINKVATLNYRDADGNPQTFTFTYSLISTLANNAPSEDIETIRRLAPTTYYTQDRMVNGADYNTYPLQDPSILKLKTVNRTFIGDSKYIAWHDPSDTYENVKLFGTDLRLYYQPLTNIAPVPTGTSIDVAVDNYIQPLLGKAAIRAFHEQYDLAYSRLVFYTTERESIKQTIQNALDSNSNAFPLKLALIDNETKAYQGCVFENDITLTTNLNDGIINQSANYSLSFIIDNQSYVINITGADVMVDPLTSGDITLPSLVEGINTAFTTNNVPATAFIYNNTLFIQSNSIGQNANIKILTYTLFTQLTGFVKFALEVVGTPTDTWRAYAADTPLLTQHGFEISVTDSLLWDVRTKELALIGESPSTRFWFNNEGKVINEDTLSVERDRIVVLKANIDRNRTSVLTQDIEFNVIGDVVKTSSNDLGTVDITKLELTTADITGDSQPDDILLRQTLLDRVEQASQPILLLPTTSVYELNQEYDVGVEEIEVLWNGTRLVMGRDFYESDQVGMLLQMGAGQSRYLTISNSFSYENLEIRHVDYLYYTRTNVDSPYEYFNSLNVDYDFKQDWKSQSSNPTTSLITRYRGRDNLNFAWFYVTPRYSLVDPAATNIHDMFVITRGYYQQIIDWLYNNGAQPSLSTPFELRSTYGRLLESKMLSDTVLLHPGKIKLLFGSRAIQELQATIKVVKSTTSKKTDNEIKTAIVDIVRDFFDINAWEFGERFSFSELAAVIHARLSSDVKTVILVPVFSANQFGDLYEITPREDEILHVDITVDNVEVIPALNARNIRQYPY